MKTIFYLGLLVACGLPIRAAEEAKDARSMAEYYGVKEIEKIFVVHWESMDQRVEPVRIELLDREEDTAKVADLLRGLSSRGNIFKSWPPDIPVIHLNILHDDGRYCTLRIFNGRLQRPDGGGYGMKDFKLVKDLLAVLDQKAGAEK